MGAEKNGPEAEAELNGDERCGGWQVGRRQAREGEAQRTRFGGSEEGHRANQGEENSAHLSERARCKMLF